MGVGRMKRDIALELIFPTLAKIPTALPWRLAAWAAKDKSLLPWLQGLFQRVFPAATPTSCANWARAHMAMLAQEKVDALAFHRLGRPGGPQIALNGARHAIELAQRGQGFILVLNHCDRLLTAPVALAQAGVATNVLTMPVLNHPDLGEAERRFLLGKIQGYTQATRGTWHTTDRSLRVVHESLRAGQSWVILADAWSADFTRLRPHSFLGGYLRLPTGIERLARSTGVPLLYASTQTLAPGDLEVFVEPLPADPEEAVNQAIQKLHADVQKRPWAWWHWGLWEQMWHPAPEEEKRDAH